MTVSLFCCAYFLCCLWKRCVWSEPSESIKQEWRVVEGKRRTRSPGVKWISSVLRLTPAQWSLSALMLWSLLCKGFATKTCAQNWLLILRRSRVDASWPSVSLRFFPERSSLSGRCTVINDADLITFSLHLSLCLLIACAWSRFYLELSVLAVHLQWLSSPASPAVWCPSLRLWSLQRLWPRVASSSHPCTFLLLLPFSFCCSRFVVPPLMCKWLEDRAKGKHELCFLGSGHAWNSSGFMAVRIPQILTG